MKKGNAGMCQLLLLLALSTATSSPSEDRMLLPPDQPHMLPDELGVCTITACVCAHSCGYEHACTCVRVCTRALVQLYRLSSVTTRMHCMMH